MTVMDDCHGFYILISYGQTDLHWYLLSRYCDWKSVHQGFKYPCTIYGYSASAQSHLNIHIQTKHKGKKYQCNVCEIEYKSQQALFYHTKTKHKSKTFDCSMCKYSAKLKHILLNHIKSVHFGDKFPCNICDYQATRKNVLAQHVKNVHQLNENINCTECNKSVKARSMKSHMKLHFKTIQNSQFVKDFPFLESTLLQGWLEKSSLVQMLY